MADFAELVGEAVNYGTEKHFDKVYDNLAPRFDKLRGKHPNESHNTGDRRNPNDSYNTGERRQQKNHLPNPEGTAPANWDTSRKENVDYRRRDSQRSPSLDRESQVSERVIRAYESERDDPSRKAESVLSKKDLKKLNNSRDPNMSYANGYASNNLAPGGYDSRRANSQQPPRSRYYDDDDSDYDERTGRRRGATGRGYGDEYEDDRGYDREVVETERYRGPARDFDARRASYGTSRNYGNEAAYGAGAVTQYRRSNQEVDDYKSQGRSRSRGRRDRDRDRERSRSYSDSRSRSRSKEGIRGKLDETFDTSMKGLGVGIAGAVVGGLAGREFGNKHKNRDIIIGALIGGLGANAAENKWRDWKDEKEDKLRKDEDKWEQRWDGRDYGRSRSAMR